MQMEASDLADFSTESKETLALYGLDQEVSKNIGAKCLMARRLVERGVRFVQVYSDGEWDAHSDLKGNHAHHCASTDLPIHGLLTDLKASSYWDRPREADLFPQRPAPSADRCGGRGHPEDPCLDRERKRLRIDPHQIIPITR
jgi:hypothetical protein